VKCKAPGDAPNYIQNTTREDCARFGGCPQHAFSCWKETAQHASERKAIAATPFPPNLERLTSSSSETSGQGGRGVGERGEQHDDEHEEPLLSIDEPLWRRRLKVKSRECDYHQASAGRHGTRKEEERGAQGSARVRMRMRMRCRTRFDVERRWSARSNTDSLGAPVERR